MSNFGGRQKIGSEATQPRRRSERQLDSRSDGEFLIRVKPEALKYLEEHTYDIEGPTGAH